MKVFDEFKGKKEGDRVRLWADKGTIESVISDGFHPKGKASVAYWVKWDDRSPSCLTFDRDGNWIRK